MRGVAQSPRGFTLVELAVVLAVLGLLLGTLLMPLAAQHDLRGRRDTERALADVREALLGYAIAKGRLPCPAASSLPTGTAGAGIEARVDGQCACNGGSEASAGGRRCTGSAVVGVLPWVSLGLPETDAWGRRYTYALDTKFGRDPMQATFGAGCAPSPVPRSAGFALCSPATVVVKAADPGVALVSGGVPAIVVSHGKNGHGAYTSQGRRLDLSAAVPAEAENANGDAIFVSDAAIDDRVIWVSPHVLMHRMLSAGTLP